MTDWLDIAREHAVRGDESVLVTICSVEGSAPREPGTKMLVWDGGQDGTIGGGNLEYVVAQQARRLLAAGDVYRVQSYPLGPLLGQCCGGRVGIFMERIDKTSLAWLSGAAVMRAGNRSFIIQSRLHSGQCSKAVFEATPQAGAVEVCDGEGGTVAPKSFGTAASFVIREHVARGASLFMFGAGHVGRALAPILASLPLHVRWFDTRLEFGSVAGPLQPIVVPDLVREATAAPPGSLFLIFTQSHDLDYALVRAVLERNDALYCGLIGSRTKRTRFERRLIGDGLRPAALAKLTCPIGAIGLSSKDPAVLAVAVAVEVMLKVEAHQSNNSSKIAHAG